MATKGGEGPRFKAWTTSRGGATGVIETMGKRVMRKVKQPRMHSTKNYRTTQILFFHYKKKPRNRTKSSYTRWVLKTTRKGGKEKREREGRIRVRPEFKKPIKTI